MATGPQVAAPTGSQPSLSRQLGLFHVTMIVMGGIVGAGIFINPAVVARRVHTPFLIVGVWVLGGLIALAGAFVYAELGARLPLVGGDYAYLREAYGPLLAFLNGWALLLVMQSGGMAAVAVTFAHYFAELAPVALSERLIAAAAIALLTVINCLGVRAGGWVQSGLMLSKILIIGALVFCGWFFIRSPWPAQPPLVQQPVSFGLFSSIGAAMIPVLFAYGGWQTANFIAGEVRDPRKILPRGLLTGVCGVVVLYVSVALVCVRALGPVQLAATSTPVSEVMRIALGPRGARLIALGIAVSTFGFLSQNILTAPRVYFAMAEDGLFFRSVGWVSPRTRVPVVAIAMQGALAMIMAVSGGYEQILNYVSSVDWIFFGLGGTCLLILRHRDAASPQKLNQAAVEFRAPGHPFTTLFFIAACTLVVGNTIYRYPVNAAIGLALMFAGIPVYFAWRRFRGPMLTS